MNVIIVNMKYKFKLTGINGATQINTLSAFRKTDVSCVN
jgi:hypothetical protein